MFFFMKMHFQNKKHFSKAIVDFMIIHECNLCFLRELIHRFSLLEVLLKSFKHPKNFNL